MSAALIGGGVFFLIILALVAYYVMKGGKEDGPVPEVKTPQTEEEKVAASATGGIPDEAKAEDDEAKPTDEDAGDEAAEKVVEEEVSQDEPDIDPSKIPGLVGYFTADSFDEKANVWKDKSGQDNHAEEVKGEPEIVEENGMKWVRGGKDAGIRFPATCMTRGKKFTLVHVARYDGQLGGRIFDGLDCEANFLSGYHWTWWGHPRRDQGYGGSHRSGTGWIAHPYGIPEDQRENFNVTVEWKNKARYNGLQRSGKILGSAVVPQQMTINWGCATTNPNSQQTEWAVAEVLFFNTELDLETTKKLETYMFKKYKRPRLVRSYVDSWNSWRLETGQWWNPYKDCSGADCADQFRVWDKMGAECGDEGAISRTFMHRHHRNHPAGSNGAYWWWQSCIAGLDQQGGEEKKTKYVNITDSTATREKLKLLTEMNCRDAGIASYGWELSNDNSRMRLKYRCSGAPVEEDSCREIQAQRHGKDIHARWPNALNNNRLSQKGPMSAMETQDLNCGTHQVLTKIEYEEDDAGGTRMKGKCCALQDV